MKNLRRNCNTKNVNIHEQWTRFLNLHVCYYPRSLRDVKIYLLTMQMQRLKLFENWKKNIKSFSES